MALLLGACPLLNTAFAQPTTPKPAATNAARHAPPRKSRKSKRAMNTTATRKTTANKATTDQPVASVSTPPPPAPADVPLVPSDNGAGDTPAEPVHAPAAAPSGVVVVPSTAHVHVHVPSGLQGWLDADDRMRPWLDKAVATADACYAQLRAEDPSAAGTIVFNVTMHANARPSANVSSMPAAIRGLVTCVTMRLLSVKMPLFTGDEGASYSVRASFDP